MKLLKHISPLILIPILVLFSSFNGGKKGKAPNKTIRDTSFTEGDIIKVPNVPFLAPQEYGQMNQQTKDSLNIIGDFLVRFPNLNVELISHTDYKGSNMYNNRLSKERARACVKYLVNERHISPSRLSAKGASEYFLLKDESDIEKAKSKEERKELHLMNVRVELVVKK